MNVGLVKVCFLAVTSHWPAQIAYGRFRPVAAKASGLFIGLLMAVDCASADITVKTQAAVDDFQATYGGPVYLS